MLRVLSALSPHRVARGVRVRVAEGVAKKRISSRQKPSEGAARFALTGDLCSSRGRKLLAALEAAASGRDLPEFLRDMPGMSGLKYRALINCLAASVEGARYLEIGSWLGSTACSVLAQNKVSALCIDNWSQFDGSKADFLSNTSRAKSADNHLDLIESDFRAIDFGKLGTFNIYMFDGPHEEKDQYDGVVLAQPALQHDHFLIIDDWNWPSVRIGTYKAILDCRLNVEASIEIRTTRRPDTKLVNKTDWHNGYFIAAISKC